MKIDKEKRYETKEDKIKRLLQGLDSNCKYLIKFDFNKEVIRVVKLED